MYKQITSNKRRSLALLFGFLLLYGAVGCPAVAVVRRMGLRRRDRGRDRDDRWSTFSRATTWSCGSSGARQVNRKEEAPELWRKVENLAITAGLPMPRV